MNHTHLTIETVMSFVQQHALEIAAILVSACALFLTIYQAMAARKHNRITVRPHLTTFIDKHSSPDSRRVDVTLSNNGLGPAVIKSFEPLFNGSPTGATDSKSLEHFVADNLGLQIHPSPSYFSFLNPGYIMAADSEMKIASFAVVMSLSMKDEAIQSALSQFEIRITYQSLYEEDFVYDSREHGT